MSFINKIKSSVENATGLQFYYGTYEQINGIIDDADFSSGNGIAYAVILGDTELIDGKEKGVVAVAFVNLTEFDFDALENDTIQESMKAKGFRWISETNKGNELLLTDIRMQRIYDEYDVNVTGLVLRATATELEGLCDGI